MRRCLAAGLVLVSMSAVGRLWAQQGGDDVSSTILSLDASFWRAYNTCDLGAFPRFFTEDVEFYHDKGGPTLGRDGLVASITTGVCGNEQSRLRREAVEGTVRVFPLRNGDTIYGAVLSGEHLFYLLDKGKPERLDGRARFTHLWLLKDGGWKMARILSYDHGPAPRSAAGASQR
jgi:ketosteroid isomerase-like protein